ncbi:hypothetical protein L1277_001647 [Okibacterium sp. HSC-33S16]|uniref:hypothetical protein n=1 Tax=Okibacterium sp. HSC-33S16 TaxID=2910965 RepID=UPI00209D5A91|nr:hypothetical protein [Okibacterium sp. HSC-33S16]MCP2031556.1 hypothetical protein [Okibacterium sp. HSC-33S16]
MTVGDLWGIILRRWYVVAFAAICTAFLVGQVGAAKPIYWTQVSVVFLRPVDAGTTNVLAGDEDSLIHFAAIVEREYNGNHPQTPTALPEATLFGEGIREGSKVSLPNAGGQWRTNFNQPALSVQVVDQTPAAVKSTLNRVLSRIEGIVADHQKEAAVAQAAYVSTSISPSVPVVTQIDPRTSRATAAALGLGALLAVVLAVVADRRLGRHELEPLVDSPNYTRLSKI